jgi:hypothetical protein
MLDKTISGSFWKQIVFAIAFTVGIFIFFAVISLISAPDITSNGKTSEQSAEQGNPLNHEIKGSGCNRYWALLSQFLDPGNIDKADEEHRVLTSLVAIAGSVTLGGLVIATLSNILERRVDRIKNGEVRYRLDGHTVIIGYDPYAVTIIKQAVNDHNTRDIVLFTSQSPIDVLKHISTFLDNNEEKKMIIYHGGRDSSEQIKTLCLQRSTSIYILGEPDDPERDSMNLHCFELVKGELSAPKRQKTERQPCNVLLQHYKEYQLAQQHDLSEEEKKYLYFRPLNLAEEWSRIILSDLSLCMIDKNAMQRPCYFPIPSEQLVAGSKKHLHLIIMGFDEMGKVFAAHALRSLHFPNLSTTKITIIDPKVQDEFDMFSSYFPGYESIYDISFKLLAETPFSRTTRDYLDNLLNDQNALPYIVISLPESDRSLAAGLNLPMNIYKNEVPVLIRYNEYHGISSLMRRTSMGERNPQYARVRFWGMTDDRVFDKTSLDLRESFADSAHRTYLQTSKQLGFYNKDNETSRDYSLLKAVYQWSNRYLADSYQIKLLSAGLYAVTDNNEYDSTSYLPITEFDTHELDAMAQMEHARWVAERVINGWTYGAKRNNPYKIHPNIAPWEQIDEGTRQYDYVLVKNMLKDLIAMGYTVVRKIA